MRPSAGIGGVWQAPSHELGTMTPEASCAAMWSLALNAGATWPTADLAIYVPIRVKQRSIVVKLFAGVSTASGNVDIGLYNAAGVKLVSTGATAAALSMAVDVTDTTISPAIYYLAMVSDNTTLQVYRDSDAAPICAATGLLTQQLAASGTLPATATWAVNQTLAYYPVIVAMLETTVA